MTRKDHPDNQTELFGIPVEEWVKKECDVEGCHDKISHRLHMSPHIKPKNVCEKHWTGMMRDAKQLVFKEEKK